MAQSARVPAWKRLGLKLQKFDQSSEQPAPQKNHHQRGDALVERKAASEIRNHSPIAPIGNTSSRLGKRKHQDDPAEPRDETSKKSKGAQSLERGDGIADYVSTTTTISNEQPARISASDTRPKGDPNYRKKKEKGQKSKRNFQSTENALASKVKVKAAKLSPESNLSVKASGSSLRTPSLSPGRLDPGATLIASTETDFPPSPPKRNEPSSSPPAQVDRRKSVTFTPDTKTVDGNSASNLFKKWAQEQKTTKEFTEAEVAQFTPPPKVHPANDHPTSNAANSKATGKKKDPTQYLDYLTQYHTDRPNWKFNKAKQNDVLDNALNIFRIPDEYSDALIAYVAGLQGAAAIERLRQRCVSTIEEVEAAGTESEEGEDRQTTEAMDDPKVRQAAQDEALKEHLTKQRRRRRLDRDLENIHDHPHADGYIGRLKKSRAQALLKALSLPPRSPSKRVLPNQDRKAPKKKKMRTVDESSDESSDSSSSDEVSSSSEEVSSDDDSVSKAGSGSDSSSDDEESVKGVENESQQSGDGGSDNDSESD
ncbi:hypothetical protein CC80DRAFT_496784 [Byssothecium circinans]|uniref:WKF domain-containing protein n=1 Tax=Byssothecium circinans TaxID=147558 RepID=A0A6A5TE18_9PLEO|nr:hypothetical protein CC80DRAFT_496784 [Byssothecium circinans]